MRIALLLSVACICALRSGYASAKPPTSGMAADTDESELSERLEEFLGGAMDSGLLAPMEHAAEQTDSRDPLQTVPVMQGPSGITTKCMADYPLDLTAYTSLIHYQSLVDYEAEGEHAAQHHQIKAHIALGLYAEAKAMLRHKSGQSAVALSHLASLLSDRGRPDVEAFRAMANCHTEGNIWVATALLARGSAEGAELMAGQMATFRELPIQIKIDVALIALPELEQSDRGDLAVKMMATFRNDEVEASSRLQFAQALLNFENGSDVAQKALLEFLAKPDYQVDVMLRLAQQGTSLDPAARSILLNEAMKLISQTSNAREIAACLRFLLAELGRSGKYQSMLELADLRTLQTPQAQDALKRYLLQNLHRDLEGSDTLRKMIVVEFLVNNSLEFESQEEAIEIWNLASKFTDTAGFSALNAKLSEVSGFHEFAAEHQADVAYRKGDYAQVYELAKSYGTNQNINLFAALSAVGEANAEKLSAYESRLERTPNASLQLIEADAMRGDWIVSNSFYVAAQAQTDAAHTARAAHVRTLKQAAIRPSQQKPPASMSGIGKLLDASSGRIAQMQGGT